MREKKGRPVISFALAVVALLMATTQISRQRSEKHRILRDESTLQRRNLVALPTDPRTEEIKDRRASFENPELTAHASECLRLSKPDMPDVQYPSDAFDHYQDIHLRLSEWTQKEGHVPHGGECGMASAALS